MLKNTHISLSKFFVGVATPSKMLLQKKQTASAYAAAAGKVGNEEKWAQAAMEYIYEKRHVNDSRKRQYDVDREQKISAAYDKYCAISNRVMEDRFTRLIDRMNEALEILGELKLVESLDEAVMLNSEQPPYNLRRATLTPPVPGYEPGFGLDVPQLRNQISEYPLVERPTDEIQYGQEESDYFPFVETHRIEDLIKSCTDKLENIHGTIREAAPLTGVEGEAWEAYVALQKKALARQQLILDLHKDLEFSHNYENNINFREEERRKRGIVPLEIESNNEDVNNLNDEENYGVSYDAKTKKSYCLPENEFVQQPIKRHFAQIPAYEPFRAY